jgi:SAM-dependent methyltransferase
MENTNCLICLADKPKILVPGHDRLYGIEGEFNVVECSECGFVYLNPRPTQIEMQKYYPEDYYSFQRWKENVGFIRFWYRKLKWDFLSRSSLTRFPAIPRFIPNGKILDFGCGSGEVLAILRSLGWQSSGIEINEKAARYARSKGLEVYTQDLKSVNFPDDHFDVVRIRSVLEHLHDVTGLLKEIHRILKSGGQLLLVVPNIESVEFKMFKENWFSLDIPRHLNHFSSKSLKNLLEKSKFKDVSFKYCGGGMLFLASIDYFLNEKRGTHGTRLANKKYLRIPSFFVLEMWFNVLRIGNLIEARAYKT